MYTDAFPRKKPFIAGFLSIIPGVGQLYNDQIGKGILIMFILGFSILLLFTGGFPFFYGPFHWNYYMFIDQHSFERLYPMVWCIIILPLIYAFAISDAVSSARRINRKNALAAQAQMQQNTAFSQPQEPHANTSENQRQHDAQQEQPNMEQNTEQASENQASTAEKVSRRFRSHGHSAKFLIGLILIIVGGMTIMAEMDLYYVTWQHFWPLIPLVFGLRLLRDYYHDHDQGQFILGIFFAAIGGIFFLENWGFAHPWSWIESNWEIALLGAGCVLVFQDFIERRKREERNKSGENKSEVP